MTQTIVLQLQEMASDRSQDLGELHRKAHTCATKLSHVGFRKCTSGVLTGNAKPPPRGAHFEIAPPGIGLGHHRFSPGATPSGHTFVNPVVVKDMTQPIVLQLQELASDSSQDLGDVLRKALTVATKLRLEEFRKWTSCELNGYADPKLLPEYRIVKGDLRVHNPIHGLMPFLIEAPRSEERRVGKGG